MRMAIQITFDTSDHLVYEGSVFDVDQNSEMNPFKHPIDCKVCPSSTNWSNSYESPLSESSYLSDSGGASVGRRSAARSAFLR
jgi:hypothetical protein